MATKKPKLEEEAISEILVVGTDSESGAEVRGEGEEEKKKKNNNNYYYYYSKPQQKTHHRLQQVAENYHPGDRLKEGTQIFIILSVQQKV